MKEKKNVIEVRNLKKYYNQGAHNEVKANDGINLKIKEGEFVAIIGPSGSGKSTLLHLIGCLDNPSSGQVLIDEIEVSKLKDDELANIRLEKIGFVFQTFNLIPGVNAIENVLMSKMPYTISKEQKKYAIKLLNKFGIGKRADHDPNELSGGEKQRVAIARSMINKPKLILADEPTGQLDTKTSKEILLLMRELNKENNQTFVIVTHDETVLPFVDRIIRRVDGKILNDTKKKKGEKYKKKL